MNLGELGLGACGIKRVTIIWEDTDMHLYSTVDPIILGVNEYYDINGMLQGDDLITLVSTWGSESYQRTG